MIPRRIIQIWGGGGELPLLGRASACNLRLLNPDFEYVLFDDDAMDRFVAEHFPAHEVAFRSLPRAIYRYDTFRYMAVCRLGGFYFDTDVLLARSLSSLVELRCVVPFERLSWTHYFWNRFGHDWEAGNYAFGAEPGHPFLCALVDNCFRALADPEWRDAPIRSLPRPLREDLHVIFTTGPGMTTRTLFECGKDASDVTVLFPDDVTEKQNWNRFGDFGVHLGSGGWRPSLSPWKRRLINLLGKRNERLATDRARRIGGSRSWKGTSETVGTRAQRKVETDLPPVQV